MPTEPSGRRGFRLLWLGDTVNALGTSVTVFVLPVIAVTSLHATVFQAGLLATARWLPALLIGLPSGAWIERSEKRLVLLACDAVSCAVMAAIPLLAAFATLQLAELYVAVIIVGSLTTVFNTAYTPYFSAVLTPGEYRSGMSRIVAARTAAQLCGPSVGGMLATLCRPPTAVLVDVGSFAVSFVCLSLLPRLRPPAVRPGRPGIVRDIRDGISYLRRDPYLSRLTAAAAAQNLLSISFGSIEVVFLLESVHATARIAGYLLAPGALGSIIGAATVPQVTRFFGDGRAIRAYMLALLPLSTLICLTERGTGYAFFIVGELALAVALTGFNVIVMAFRQVRVPAFILARVSATMQVCLTSTMPLGGILGGALAEAIGVRNALWLILPCMALPGLTLLSGPFKKLRELPKEAVSPLQLQTTEGSAN